MRVPNTKVRERVLAEVEGANGWVTRSAVRHAIGRGPRVVREAAADLIAEGLIQEHVAPGRGAAYALPGLARPPAHWTREEAVIALRAYAEAYGRPTFNSLTGSRPEVPSRGTLQVLFGSFREAMRAAGFEDWGPGQGNGPRYDPHRTCPRPGCLNPASVRAADERCLRCRHYHRQYGREWAPEKVANARRRRVHRAEVNRPPHPSRGGARPSAARRGGAGGGYPLQLLRKVVEAPRRRVPLLGAVREANVSLLYSQA